jgi:acetyl-CoA C-acetyltransferase
MRIDPRTPVVVGVGQATNPPGGGDAAAGLGGGSSGSGDGIVLAERPEPIGLMVLAVEAAAEDCDGAPPGGTAAAGRRLIARAQSIRVVNPLSWTYADPGLAVAQALGIEPGQTMVTSTGGNNPQSMVNATSLAIGRGELDVAVLVGAECEYTQAAARRDPDRPVLPWTVQAPDTPRPGLFGTDRRGTTDAEEERGLDLPVHVYPLFENAIRAEAGRTLERHRDRIGWLWSRFSEVAAANPDAWLRRPMGPEEVAEVSEGNRMIAYPYTKLLTANPQVDQGAALILCSAEAAEAAGVPRERWVFPLAGADANDHWFLSHRRDFHSSPAIRQAGASVLTVAGRSIDEVAHIDLYSCFPSAVEIAADELGLDIDDSSRPLTVTGGMTFAGGPGNNYGTHAVASMVTALRGDPGSLGLVTGVGWYLTKHSVGLYGTEPSRSGPGSGESDGAGVAGLPERTQVEGVAGFAWADPQLAVSGLPQCTPDADATGEVSVETYSVSYDRGGSPVKALVACRTPEGLRTWATVTDPDQLLLLVTEEGCGRLGTLRGGEVDLR